MKTLLLVCCAALTSMSLTPVVAQDAAVKKIIEMGKTDNQVMHQLDILTNRFGGRPIGSDAMITQPNGCCASSKAGVSKPT